MIKYLKPDDGKQQQRPSVKTYVFALRKEQEESIQRVDDMVGTTGICTKERSGKGNGKKYESRKNENLKALGNTTL